MALVTQGSAMDMTMLEDGKWYPMYLDEIVQAPPEQATKGPATRFSFKFTDNDDWPSLYVFASNRIGKQQGTGKPSKLRQVVGALTNHPTAIDPESWEDEQFVMTYPDGPQPIRAGMPIVARGAFQPRADGEGDRFRLEAFRPAVAGATTNTPPTAAQTVAPATPRDGVPF